MARFRCDSPYLTLAALQAIGPLTGTGKGNNPESLAWTLYTGDLEAHDPQTQMSKAYMHYVETSVFNMMKSYISGPVFAALGNHDTSPEVINAPKSFPGPLGQQESWNYDHVARLWLHEGWISHEAAREAHLHYGGYSIKTHYGLRIKAFNTDLWYKLNFLTFINSSNPDSSGMFSWMMSELQKAEDAGERVLIIGHALSGWDGSNPLPNPTNLFYQIVDRYSPHVIANVFFGHTHEDQFMIYYANNGTVQDADHALMTGWIAPSVTPLTNFEQWIPSVRGWHGRLQHLQRLHFLQRRLGVLGSAWDWCWSAVSSRILDPRHIRTSRGWQAEDPLNATFWHLVTEAMERNITLVGVHNTLMGKLSVMSPNCTTAECQKARICYMRSGSVALGSQCKQGNGSVQCPFKPH